MYPIEKGVPLPYSGKILHLRAMEPGDSIFVPHDAGANKGKMRNRIGGWITRERISFPEKKFTVMANDGGHRVWRVK